MVSTHSRGTSALRPLMLVGSARLHISNCPRKEGIHEIHRPMLSEGVCVCVCAQNRSAQTRKPPIQGQSLSLSPEVPSYTAAAIKSLATRCRPRLQGLGVRHTREDFAEHPAIGESRSMLHTFLILTIAAIFQDRRCAAQSSKTGLARTATTPPRWRAKTTTSRRALDSWKFRLFIHLQAPAEVLSDGWRPEACLTFWTEPSQRTNHGASSGLVSAMHVSSSCKRRIRISFEVLISFRQCKTGEVCVLWPLR